MRNIPISNYMVMITSSNGNIFRVTGHLCEEFTDHRWIPRTKASDTELWWSSLIYAWINGWVNNREAGDLGRRRTHYDVTVMLNGKLSWLIQPEGGNTPWQTQQEVHPYQLINQFVIDLEQDLFLLLLYHHLRFHRLMLHHCYGDLA